MSWEYKTLDQLGEVSRGRSKHRPRNNPSLFGGKYPFIQTADVKAANFYITEYDTTYNEKGLAQSRLWNPGTLCITIAANIADTGILAMDACFPDSVMGFLPYEGIADVRFVKYCFDILQQNCKKISQGAAQDNLSWEKLSTILFPAPPIEVQTKIADILSTYDNLIENNKKQIKLLEEAAQRLYKEWFVDLRFPGYETTPIVDGIPQGWERMVLSEVTSVLKRGISPKYSDNGKYSVINQKCIRSSIMDISESRRQEKEYAPTLNLQDGDTVICSTGTGTLGRVGRVYGDYPNTTFDSHVTLVRAKENPNYIYHVVKSQQEYLMGMGRGSTNQQELYRDVIERLVVLCPSQDILLKADRVLNAIHCKIKAVYLQNNLLVESRDRLLPKLMNGELEV